jgi:hypothetical protein
MKKFNCFLVGSIAISISFFLSGCQKQLEDPATNEVTSPPSTTGIICKPALFGVVEEGPGGNTWTTIAQKWYLNGKVRYFKGRFSGASPGYGGFVTAEPHFNIDWGEVTFEGNQVYLKDVARDRIVFRVMLDDQGRPAASYLYNQTGGAGDPYIKDTTYYYYTGDRLDRIIHFDEVSLNPPTIVHEWGKYTFDYDAQGNMTGADILPALRMNLIYDYTKPVTGTVSNYILTTSFRLMEFLELIKVPMNHVLIENNFGDYSNPGGGFFMLFQARYANYAITDGLVQSYEKTGSPKQTFYLNWDCQ